MVAAVNAARYNAATPRRTGMEGLGATLTLGRILPRAARAWNIRAERCAFSAQHVQGFDRAWQSTADRSARLDWRSVWLDKPVSTNFGGCLRTSAAGPCALNGPVTVAGRPDTVHALRASVRVRRATRLLVWSWTIEATTGGERNNGQLGAAPTLEPLPEWALRRETVLRGSRQPPPQCPCNLETRRLFRHAV